MQHAKMFSKDMSDQISKSWFKQKNENVISAKSNNLRLIFSTNDPEPTPKVEDNYDIILRQQRLQKERQYLSQDP